jgi:precorrin-2 dehydrogenase / sirohydrochlorin ferrochelatase
VDTFCSLQVDLRDRPCLIIGGGAVAERKLKVLQGCGAKLTVVSPVLNEALKALVAAGLIDYTADIYRPVYLDHKFLVICATNKPEINRQAAADCLKRGILVNTVSEPASCSFFMPAIYKKGLLSIAVSTAGSSPILARRIKDQIARMFDDQFDQYLQFLKESRLEVLNHLAAGERRKAVLEELAGDHFFEQFRKMTPEEAIAMMKKMIAEAEEKDRRERN